MSQHVSILWDLTDIENCGLAYPQEAQSMGKPRVLTDGDKALVLCELSAMLGNLNVLPQQNSLKPNMSVVEYASGISISGLRVLSAYFAKLKRPLRVEDLGALGKAKHATRMSP